jgi:hypothetical protein
MIITKQNTAQINIISRMDKRMQKNFKAINIRITRGLENDLNFLQIQIITQVGQKIDCINLTIQKLRTE